jgi:hypothetical protein
MQLRWNLIQYLFIENDRKAGEVSAVKVAVVVALPLAQSISVLVDG